MSLRGILWSLVTPVGWPVASGMKSELPDHDFGRSWAASPCPHLILARAGSTSLQTVPNGSCRSISPFPPGPEFAHGGRPVCSQVC